MPQIVDPPPRTGGATRALDGQEFLLAEPMSEIETRTALLQAAEELFSAHGYEAVGIREISARAGTNVSSIKYHFGSKRELYLETIRWVLQHPEVQGSWEAFENLPNTQLGAATVIVGFLRGALTQAVEGGRPERYVRLMIQESLRPGEDFEFIVSNFSHRYEHLMVELVRTLAPDRDEAFYVTSGRSIFAQFLHYFVWKPFIRESEYGNIGEEIPTDQAADVVAALVLRGLGCSEELIEKAMAIPIPPSSSSPRGVP